MQTICKRDLPLLPLWEEVDAEKSSFTSPLVGEVDPKGRVRGNNADIKRGRSGREQVLKIAAPARQKTIL